MGYECEYGVRKRTSTNVFELLFMPLGKNATVNTLEKITVYMYVFG